MVLSFDMWFNAIRPQLTIFLFFHNSFLNKKIAVIERGYFLLHTLSRLFLFYHPYTINGMLKS